MAEDRLPLLRGRISRVSNYSSPRTRRDADVPLPPVEPAEHSARLRTQLDAIESAAAARPAGLRDPLANREIVAIHPKAGAKLVPDQLDDARNDARLVGVKDDFGTVILDVASIHLDYLRTKVDAFADDARVKEKEEPDGSISRTRAAERAIAPIETVGFAALRDIRGPLLQVQIQAGELVDDQVYWFELACRGGYRRPMQETETSRMQVTRQVRRLGHGDPVDEFIGPEQAFLYARLTPGQLDALIKATDCIYEVELAPPPVRDLRLLDEVRSADLRSFTLQPPSEDAPSVVILDTGVATQHPLLKPAIHQATSVVPGNASPEDLNGHGTQMAGVILYDDLGAALAIGGGHAPFWLQSVRVMVEPGEGTSSDENYEKWPVLTMAAIRSIEEADPVERRRAYALAITRSMQEPPLDEFEAPTLWSQAIDQLAYGGGHGRLIITSAGNARPTQWLALAQQFPDLQLSEKIHQPAQAANTLTVGAFTNKTMLPGTPVYAEAQAVATVPGGISPYTSTGVIRPNWPIKPDVVFEGGNLAIAGDFTDPDVPTLCTLTTSRKYHFGSPLGYLAMTSEATARAARLAALIWKAEPDLRPETVRGLIVHAASWTDAMMRQFPTLSDRLMATGYGVPDESLARDCLLDRATVIVEDTIPNAVTEEEPKKEAPKRPTTKLTESKDRRKVKIFRLPIPEDLLGGEDADVELRVTLSYFAEPHKYGRRVYHGLDLKWDMQGSNEEEAEFLARINKHMRPKGPDGRPQKPAKTTSSFDWQVGPLLRGRGTVQSDRWRGKMSELVGDKLIAVFPVLGWWDQRSYLKEQVLPFSLIVSVQGPGVYTVIKPHVEVPLEVPVEAEVEV